MSLIAAFALLSAAPSLPPLPEGAFTIAVIPDTQGYQGQGTKREPESQAPVTNPAFEAITGWIADNAAAQRIVFATHVGDIVDRNEDRQWAVARRAMDRLHGKLPYGISVGNHDMTGAGDSRLFQKWFGAERFSGMPWYGGFYPGTETSGSNANSYQLFEFGGTRMIFLHLECNAPDPVLEWANGVLSRHADRIAFATTHMDLGPAEKPTEGEGYFTNPKGRMLWTKIHGDRGNNGQQIWDKCFRKHSGLRAVFCGDQSRSHALTQVSYGDARNRVVEMMSDYGSTDIFRLCRFLPRQNRMDVFTYRVRDGQLVESTSTVPEASEHNFSLPFSLQPTPVRKAE